MIWGITCPPKGLAIFYVMFSHPITTVSAAPASGVVSPLREDTILMMCSIYVRRLLSRSSSRLLRTAVSLCKRRGTSAMCGATSAGSLGTARMNAPGRTSTTRRPGSKGPPSGKTTFHSDDECKVTGKEDQPNQQNKQGEGGTKWCSLDDMLFRRRVPAPNEIGRQRQRQLRHEL